MGVNHGWSLYDKEIKPPINKPLWVYFEKTSRFKTLPNHDVFIYLGDDLFLDTKGKRHEASALGVVGYMSLPDYFKPSVLSDGVNSLHVCAPNEYSDERITRFANKTRPGSRRSTRFWRINTLDKPRPCMSKKGFHHITLTKD